MYKPEIDGLRAIAVLSVIINHFDKNIIPNGHLGVDIFYVISGFVITNSLLSKQYDSFYNFIVGFYTRRIKRIVPALFTCIFVTSILVFLFFSPEDNLSIISIITGISALFGASNIFLFFQATDYFGSSAELNPFTHTWSLGVEEQFYFLFPLIVWHVGLLKNKKVNSVNYFIVTITLLCVTSLCLYISLARKYPISTFYLMPTRFWELSLGVLAYFFLEKVYDRIGRQEKIKFINLIILLLIFIIFFTPKIYLQQEYAVVLVVLFTFIFMLTTHHNFFTYKVLASKYFVSIGIISYSLYIWHWPIIAISRSTIGISLLTVPFQIILIFLISISSYKFIESPLRRANWIKIKIGVFTVGTVWSSFIMAIILSILIFTLQRQGRLFYTGTSASLIKKGVQTLQDKQEYKGYYWISEKCILSSNGDVNKIITPDECTFGDFHSAKKRFLVIGNSFSAAEIEMFKILPEQQRGSVTITSCWGASPVPEIENNGPWDKANKYYWNSVIPSLLNQLRSGDVLLMINDGAGFSPKNNAEPEKIMLNINKGLKRISDEMLKKGISVIYQSGNPFMRESNCTPDTAVHQWWNFFNNQPCVYYTKNETIARRKPFHDFLLGLQEKQKNFFVLDILDIFCPENVCKFYNKEGIFLYRDEWSHPSIEASTLAQPLLLKTVDRVIRSTEKI